MKKAYIALCISVGILLVAILWAATGGWLPSSIRDPDIKWQGVDTVTSHSGEYAQGFADAIQCMSLLNLELSLQGKAQTYGEMGKTCFDRYQLKVPDWLSGASK